ncbi:divalent-cation tolerance protein CutA [Nonomuraea muscovyensis]|uniref:divalent-cation tolerance protein CutA n=1 Tax=Nonomuraea muscovyensis TaxID=1124761 RepID=UPI0033F12545|nr:CutA1 divalent ion tolerance protein [Nonomuraea muscovyensis]
MADYIEVHVTAGDRGEAARICRVVVERRLAACAQVVGPITSTYWWEGKVEEAEEWLLLLKTTADLFDDLAASVREAHSYDVPEIIAVPVRAGSTDYLAWVARETGPGSGVQHGVG